MINVMNKIDEMKQVVMLLRDGPDNHVQEAVDLLCQAIRQAELVSTHELFQTERAIWAESELACLVHQAPVAWWNPAHINVLWQEHRPAFDDKHEWKPLFLAAGANPPAQQIDAALTRKQS
jgi:hypothetical protein